MNGPPVFGGARVDQRWWRPFLVGTAAGFAAGILLGLGRRAWAPAEAAPRPVPPPPEEGWMERALAELSERMESIRARLAATGVAPDVQAIQDRIRALPDGDSVEVRDLGDGIVEVVGSAPDEETARVLLDAAGSDARVRVVVNRVWTPPPAVHNVPGL